MQPARALVPTIFFVCVAACVSRADTPVATIDERETAYAAPLYSRGNTNDIFGDSVDVASFTVAATATARASSAVLHTRLTSREPTGSLSPTAVVTIDDAEPIVDAIVKTGVRRTAITLHQVLSAPDHQSAIPGAVDIDVSLTNTAPEYIRSLGKTISDADGYPIYHAFSDVTFRVDDCVSLLNRARQAAFRQALAAATRAVPGPHPHLGPIVAVREQTLSLTEGTCGTTSDPVNSTPVYRNGNFETANGGNVVAASRLTVGYRLLP